MAVAMWPHHFTDEEVDETWLNEPGEVPEQLTRVAWFRDPLPETL